MTPASQELASPQRIITYITSDVVQRWKPDMPCVFVATTKLPANQNDVALARRQRSSRKSGVTTIEVLGEGTESEFTTNRETLKNQKEAVRNRLAQAGYTVNPVKNPYCVYVVELAGLEAKFGPGNWLYVGETAKSAEERIAQHRSGVKKASVAKYFARRRPDLEPTAALHSRSNSVAAEAEHAAHLRSLGYKVLGPDRIDRPAPKSRD
jgi:predicted GIY-YIG superfamily endonuclease